MVPLAAFFMVVGAKTHTTGGEVPCYACTPCNAGAKVPEDANPASHKDRQTGRDADNKCADAIASLRNRCYRHKIQMLFPTPRFRRNNKKKNLSTNCVNRTPRPKNGAISWSIAFFFLACLWFQSISLFFSIYRWFFVRQVNRFFAAIMFLIYDNCTFEKCALHTQKKTFKDAQLVFL